MNKLDESLAKIARPRNRRIYPRASLFAKLDHAAAAPGIWICGPPGSGKTTLISSYLQARNRTCLWYQVDGHDSDIANIYWYLRIAAKKVSHGSANDLDNYTSAYHGSPDIFATRYFESLYASLPPNFLIVLDDYHLAEGDAALDAVIEKAIAVLPRHGNVAVLSREQPSPAFCRLRGNEMLQLIGWDDLRLTPEEMRGISSLRQSKHPESCLKHIEAISDGWAAGLIFKLQHNHSDSSDDIPVNTNGHEGLFGYFANEVLDKQEPESQTIVMQLALLPAMTQDMARRLTDSDRAISILKWMHRNNNFVELHELELPMYRFHPLFRDFLLDRLRRHLAKTDLQKLENKAARLLEEYGYVGSARRLYQSAGDWNKVVELILSDAPKKFRRGQISSLEKSIRDLPRKIIDADPWLLYWLGAADMFLHPQRAHQYFSTAFKLFQERADTDGLLAAWSGAVNSLLAEWADMAALRGWIDPGEKLLPADGPLPGGVVGAHAITAMCAALSICRPNSPNLDRFVRETHELILTSGDQTFRLMACNLLIIFYAWQGKLSSMRLLVDALRPAIEKDVQSNVHQVMWAAAEGWSDLVSGEPEKCLEKSVKALELSRKCGVHMFDYKFHGMSTQANLVLGDADAAREHIDGYLSVISGKATLLHFHAHFLCAWQAWLTGRNNAAREQLKSASQFLESAGSAPILFAKTQIAEAILCLDAEEIAEARDLLASADRIASAAGSVWLQYHCLLVNANLERRHGSKDWCLQYLRLGLEVGRAHGLLMTDWWDASSMSHLCDMALANDIEPQHVRRLIAAARLRPVSGIQDSTAWPWPVTINVLGKFQLKVQGKPVRSRTKSQKKVLDLLKALVSIGGGSVSAARLADGLWPDAEGDDGRNALKTTVHRLRKLLAATEAVEFKDGFLSLSPDYCWVDMQVFQALAKTPLSSPDRIRRLKRALKLYRGPLLAAEEEAHWAIAPRARLQKAAHKIVMEVGMWYESSGKWNKAIRVYRSGLNKNAVDEQVWRHLMLCYQRSGRDEDALASYQQCCRELKEKLARNPSAKTKILAESIVQH